MITTIDIPVSHQLNAPLEVPAILAFTGAFDSRLEGAVDPALYGRGSVNGNITGPFFEEWGGEYGRS